MTDYANVRMARALLKSSTCRVAGRIATFVVAEERTAWKGLRRGFYAFAGAVGFFLVRLLADYLDSSPLAVIATIGVAACVGLCTVGPNRCVFGVVHQSERRLAT